MSKQSIKETVIAPGKLKLADEQFIYAQDNKGEVEKVLVKEGDKVKKGDKLIHYKNEKLLNEQKKIKLEINSNYLELEHIQKQRNEINKKLEKEKDNNQLQSEYNDIVLQLRKKNIDIELMQLEKKSIEQEIADTTIKSDIDGEVVAINDIALSGAEQSEQQPIIRIGSLDTMLVKGKISEYDTLKIKEGQSVKLTSDAIPNKYWMGKISFISDLPEQPEPGKDDSGANYVVEAKVKEEMVPLKPGFRILMEIETDKKKTDALPLSAVKRGADTDYVYVVEDGIAMRKEIKTGIATNKLIEIKGGLKKKAEVVLNPDEVMDGMEVTKQ